MSAALPPWAMAQNLVLQAGAGTGKTHALVTLALHLLSGATAKRTPVPPARLVALTFTEKAGAEMRERLQRRLTPLANGTPLEVAEPELNATFELLGMPKPGVDMWQRIRRDIAFATIGTFHSFCAFQLRRLAPFVGLDPAFEVLDDDESRSIFEDATEGYILSALASGDAGVRALVDEFALTSDRPKGLIELTRDVLVALEEDGRPPRSLDDGRFADALAAKGLAEAIEHMQDAVSDLTVPTGKTKGGFADLIREFQHSAASLSPQSVDRDIEKLAALRKQMVKPRGDAGATVARFDERLAELRVAAAGIRSAPLGRAFVDVLCAVEQRYAAAKRARNAADFSDLQRIFRNALRDDPAARLDMKSRLDALLVDEFQDTSRLQLDIVALLAEIRGTEADLRTADIASTVRWEPGFLCVVGDRKQSIYEFRGADVSVFSRLQDQLSRPEVNETIARVEYLQRSYRSRPRLVSLVNTLFKRAMPANGLPFEVAFTDGDALTPKLDEEVTRPLGQIIQAVGTKAEEHRPDEAKRIAAHIDAILHEPKERLEVRVPGQQEADWRPAEGRDIVLLFRRLTNVNIYRAALSERGIPHVLVGGGGFYATQEVLDAWALLRALDDPSDGVASTALLRSPWCTLSDETISRLAIIKNGEITAIRGVTLERLIDSRPQLEDAGEQARLDTLLDFVQPLLRGLDQIGTAEALSLALEELDYLAVIAPQSDAESIAANLDKLLNILKRLEQRHTTPRGVIRTLTERIWFGHREPEAASTEESDPRCVRLMTIHQAKGLEFPIVIIPECGASDPPETSRIAYDRDLGLGLNVRLENEQLVNGPGLDDIRERLMARRRAESLRLFYVALTRARDHVVVSGVPGKSSWFDLFAALGDEHVRRVDVDPTIPPRRPVTELIPESTPDDWHTPPKLTINELHASTEELNEFKTCPERFRLRHLVQLNQQSERPRSHELLASIDVSLLEPERRRAALDLLLRASGHSLTRPEATAARAEAEALLNSRFANEAARVPTKQQIRAVPYSLRVDVDDQRHVVIQGRIDWAVLTGGAARLVRYRRPESTDDGFELKTAAVALQKLLDGALPIEAGTATLREGEEVSFQPLPSAALSEHSGQLQQLGRELLESHSSNAWARRDRTYCDSMQCTYRARCFGES